MRDAKRHSASFINFFLTSQLKYDDVQFAILNGVVPVARTRSFNAALSSVARRVEAQTAHFVLTDTAAVNAGGQRHCSARTLCKKRWSLGSFISKKAVIYPVFLVWRIGHVPVRKLDLRSKPGVDAKPDYANGLACFQPVESFSLCGGDINLFFSD